MRKEPGIEDTQEFYPFGKPEGDDDGRGEDGDSDKERGEEPRKEV